MLVVFYFFMYILDFIYRDDKLKVIISFNKIILWNWECVEVLVFCIIIFVFINFKDNEDKFY